MALFKILKGNENNLPTTKTPGYMYITEDQGNIFVDLSATERIQLNAKHSSTTDKWKTARTITLSGDATGSTSIDGSSNVGIVVTVKDDSHNHVISNVDGLQSALDSKAPNTVATQSTNGLMSSSDKIKLDGIKPKATPIYYGVCSSAAADAAKTLTVDDSFELVEGAQVTVKFTYANSVASPTLNVNNTGAKEMRRYGTTDISTATTTTGWIAGAIQIFTYDGTAWIRDYWNNTTYSNASLGQGYATCSTTADTSAKVASLSSYSLTTGGIVAVKFTYEVPAGATLNINSKGAKAIYHRGSAIKAGVIKAGDTATFIYNGSYYHLLTVDRDENDDAKVTNTLNTTAKAYITGTTSATTNTGTQVFDTGVYLDTTAGQLVATTFKGNLEGNAATATKATQDGNGNNIVNTYETKANSTSKVSILKSELSPLITANAEAIEGLNTSKQNTITGAATTIVDDDLTVSRALISNGSGKIDVSPVTSTELGYLDGVTSNVQTQLNAKQATITGSASTVTNDNLTASMAVVTNSAGKLAASSKVTVTELEYLDGVTSNIQTQLNAKQATISLPSNSVVITDDNGELDVSAVSDTNLSHLIGVTSNIQTQLNAKQATITGGASSITSNNLTASRALVSNSSGKVAVSDVTATELGYLDGVTSNIQTQLNAKQATVTGAATTVVNDNLTASRVVVSNSSGKLAASSSITTTELGYLDGVSSNIQTQLNAKQASITGAASTITSDNLSTDRVLISNSSGKVGASAITSTELSQLDGIDTTKTIQTQLDNLEQGIEDAKVYADGAIATAVSKKQDTITGAATTITSNNLTPSRALISNASGKVAISDVTSTELGYLDGVTSNIQTQLNNKAGLDTATTSANGLMSSTDKSKLDYTNIAYGTCTTAAGTAAKVVTLTGNSNWALTPGATIVVKFSYTNSANNPTLNVNNTGAKSVYYNTGVLTTSSVSYAGYKDRYITYVYDGTNYVFQGWSYDSNTTYTNASLGQGYGTCSTAAATTEKAVSLSSYALTTGGIVSVKFTNAVPASASMNINSKGAKAIYYRGSAITNDIIKAGDTATFIYNGSYYHLVAIDRWQEDIEKLTSDLEAANAEIDGSIKSLSVNGKVITYTKNDGTTGTITTYDSNTDTKVTNTLNTTTKAYITGTTSASTNTGTQIFDTGVYLDTTAGQLTATTFKGALSGNASTATKATQDASGNVITSTYETKTDATAKLTEAKTYAATVANNVKNDLLNGAGAAYDTLKELGDLIDDNTDAIDALELVAAGKQDAITGAASSVTTNNLTASRALVSDSNGKIAVSSNITTTELGYLDGVTSNLQTQLNAKQATITGAASTVTSNNLTASRVLVSDSSGKIAASSAITTTELGYLDGATANIQSQINGLNNKEYWANLKLSNASNSNSQPTFSPEFKFNVDTNSAISGGKDRAISSPIPKYMWHDLFSFGMNGTPTVEVSSNGTAWSASTNENYTKKLFIQKEDQAVEVLNDTQQSIRWTWYNTNFHACSASYLNIGFTYNASQATFNILFETSKDGSTWTEAFSAASVKYSQTPYWFYVNSGWSSQYYVRLTLTRTSDSGSGTKSGLSCIRLLTSRWGNQGRGAEYEKPYDWDLNQNIYPRTNNASTLGTAANKWANVYATTFNGDLSGNATSLTGLTATVTELNVLDGITATTAELNYVDGVTSNIQTQLNAKQATITGGASTITSSNLTASRALVSNSSGKVAVSAVTSTELGYLDGVTSAIQTQLDSKASKDVATTSANGLMSSTDKTKLDGIRAKATPNYYGECSTAADTAAKVVTVADTFVLEKGAQVTIKFTNANSVSSPTLNVNGTGAKAIKRYGTTAVSTGTTTTGWVAGAVQLFTYDGTNWVRDYWNNTTYNAMTAATASAAGKAGLVPAPGAGKQNSFLRGDGTWATPTNTTYSAMTGATASTAGTSGLVPAPAAGNQGLFLRGDGTWATPTDTNTDTKVTQTSSTTSGNFPILMAVSTSPTSGSASTSIYNTGVTVNPNTKTVTATTFKGALSGNADTATKATQDGSGNTITSTYIKGLSVNGKVITYTKGDGTTGTITTQDNNTDTKVTQTASTTDGNFPILLTSSTSPTSGNASTSIYNTNVKVNPSTGTIDAKLINRNGIELTRIFGSLIPYGTAIAENKNLNTVEFLKVGNYYCSKNATVETLTNCPTSHAFMVQVISPLSTTLDNESTGTWVYRVRKMLVYNGDEFVQQVYSNGTAGNFTYGAWNKVIKSNNTATADNAGIIKVSSVNSSAVTVNSESTTAGRYYPVELNSDGKAIVNVPWTNTNTDTNVTNTLSTSTKFYVTGTSSATTNTGSQYFDTGVYVDTTAGKLVATTFSGSLSGNASSASKVANALSINGKTYDGSAAITVGTLGVSYGGTGITSNPSMLVNLGSTSAATIFTASPRPGVTGTLGAANGGTGKTTLKDSANALLNALDTGSSVPEDNDYYISQYVNGGTTTTTYHRRPMSALFSYVSGKLGDTYVKKTGDTMTGNLNINRSNPYVGFVDTAYSTVWYIQAYQDSFGFGPSWANAFKSDKNGNTITPGTSTIGNKVKLSYNSTKECLDFIFV